MPKKKSEILSIEGKEEELPERQQILTTGGPRPLKKRSGFLTTRDLDADGKLIKKREARDD